MDIRTVAAAPSITPVRSALAAFLAFLLIAAGAVGAAPARAVENAVIAGTVSTANEEGLTVSVQVSGLGDATHAYAALIVKGTESGITGGGGFAAFAHPFPSIVDGASAFDLVAPRESLERTEQYEVLIWQAQSPADESSIYARSDVSVSSTQWDSIFPPAVAEPGPVTDPATEPADDQATEPADDQTADSETPAFTPQLAVYLADGVTPVGDTIVRKGDTLIVRGSGYDPGANIGGRGAPIPSTLPQGTYVVFGHFADAWKPSQGAASDTRKVGSQAWALAESVLDLIPSRFQSSIRAQWAPLDVNGSFEVPLTVTAPSSLVAGGHYGVFTYGAGGVHNAEQEREVSVSVMPEPELSVFLADGVTPVGDTVVQEGDSLVVRGVGYDPQANVGGRGVPIPSTLPQGTYVVFGHFAEQWQPSAGASGEARKSGAQKWALAESVLEQVPSRYQSSIRSQWAPLSEDGTFETTVTVDKPATLAADGHYGVFTYGAGGVANAAQEREVPVNLYAPALSVTIDGADVETGLTVGVNGTYFGSVGGAYAALIEKGSEASVGMGGGYTAFGYWMSPGSIVQGTFAKTLVASAADLKPAKEYEVIVWKGHTAPTSDTIYARADVPLTPAVWERLRDAPVPTPTPTKPVPTTPPVDPAPAGGSLRWAVSSGFTSYVTGDIARGSIAVAGGATRSGGLFQFGQASGSTFDAVRGTGSTSYNGSVRFTGHGGVLDVTIANPQVRFSSPSSATLWVTTGGRQVAFATLDLTAGARLANGGAVTFIDVPARLTSSGREQVLAGFSTSLDPITFTVGSPAAAPAGSTGTVAVAAARTLTPRASIPAAPPAVSGIVLEPAQAANLAAGSTFTLEVDGFTPNETGIALVVYSSPTVVASDLTADAEGVVRWTGSLPAALADGEHTLTVQGSISKGIVFTLQRDAAALGSCAVTAASLEWGFKDSFRTYIEGVAGGGWDLSGVAYEYPRFVWNDGSGTIDDETASGLVTFGGSIRFTGHDGALDTTLGNARIELAGDTGYVLFDVTGTTQGGESVAANGIRFAQFAVPEGALGEQELALRDVATTLTAEGAAAFGSYPEGEQLDTLSATMPLTDVSCASAVAPIASDDEPQAAAPIENTATTGDAPVWPWVTGGVVLALLIAAAATYVIRRRTAARDAEPADARDETMKV